MSDSLRNRGELDRDRIDVSQEHECRYWTDKFGVTYRELRAVVEKVGPMVKDVEKYFAGNKARAKA